MKSIIIGLCLVAAVDGLTVTPACGQLDTAQSRSVGIDTNATTRREVLDSAFARARRLVVSGQVVAGRKMGDSILATTREGTEAYGDALYGVATLAPTATEAAVDYQRIIVEYPLSAHAGDALLQLAQLERSQGDRAAAIGHLQRYFREDPTNPKRAAPGIWLAQLLFEQGDDDAACGVLTETRRAAAPTDVESQNQINFYSGRCAAVTARHTADSTARADSIRSDSTARAVALKRAVKAKGVKSPLDKSARSAGTGSGRYTVQLAAYATKADAERLVAMLHRRGVEARVEGDRNPFRVRVGYYKTRTAAEKAAVSLATVGYRGFVASVDGH